MTAGPFDSMNLEMQMMMGLQITVLHIFSCLNAKGILPFSEAAQSLQETVDILESAPDPTKATIQLIVRTLEKYAGENYMPDPTKPPPPTRLH